MRFISSHISFKICVSVLIFCFDDLSIGVSGVLKSLTIIVLLSISPFMSVSVCLMYWWSPMLGASVQFSSVQLLSRVWLFVTQRTAAYQASLSIATLGVYSKSCPLSQWCHLTISSFVIPFSSHLQSFLASGSGCIDIYNCYAFFLDWPLDHYVGSLSFVIFFILRSILSDMRIATPAFFCFPFSWNIFFHPLTFSLHVSWDLKWVLQTAYIWVLFLYPFSQSVSFGWSI